jgi:small subunit ribosomal protein S1
LEEGYWAALLSEGEFAPTAFTDRNYENGEAPPSPAENSPIQNGAQGSRTWLIESDWHEIQRLMDDDTVVELKVTGYNRGGLLVEWKSLQGFVPASQLMENPTNGNGIYRPNSLSSFVGQLIKLRVIELSAEHNRLIFSERAARVAAGERADILRRLQVGDIVSGVITNLCDFGAFVDLGGLEGLIHISELSWGRVARPGDILKQGQQVVVHVLDVERNAGRVALSLKRLTPDPWATVSQRYSIGQIIEGTITNVVDFGAFACIEEGLEGLIHVSELAEGHFLHPRNVVTEGQPVLARVLSIDSHARRLGLSLRLNG